jgi:hypothetical protein
MDLSTLTAVFGWMTLLNTALLSLAALILIAGKTWITRLHGRIMHMPEDDIARAHFAWLANFKIAVIVFNLVPWLALLIVG